ncbi:unnamed protein product [Paramecium primaurelia]|uniref:Uncharacterized protein n=2 Tax=Paramecium TaxID=5884 RepID=A0A8S1U5L6_9CILI|nr:unnamed protein product [Paramecium primaurelia]CAD8159908.1 unnamed protein product [Paramecium pentaurelia]
MGCSLQKSSDHKLASKKCSANENIQTPEKKSNLEVYNPIIGKMVSVPILVPASKSSILKRRSTQMTIGQ